MKDQNYHSVVQQIQAQELITKRPAKRRKRSVHLTVESPPKPVKDYFSGISGCKVKPRGSPVPSPFQQERRYPMDSSKKTKEDLSSAGNIYVGPNIHLTLARNIKKIRNTDL